MLSSVNAEHLHAVVTRVPQGEQGENTAPVDFNFYSHHHLFQIKAEYGLD